MAGRPGLAVDLFSVMHNRAAHNDPTLGGSNITITAVTSRLGHESLLTKYLKNCTFKKLVVEPGRAKC